MHSGQSINHTLFPLLRDMTTYNYHMIIYNLYTHEQTHAHKSYMYTEENEDKSKS